MNKRPVFIPISNHWHLSKLPLPNPETHNQVSSSLYYHEILKGSGELKQRASVSSTYKIYYSNLNPKAHDNSCLYP